MMGPPSPPAAPRLAPWLGRTVTLGSHLMKLQQVLLQDLLAHRTPDLDGEKSHAGPGQRPRPPGLHTCRLWELAGAGTGCGRLRVPGAPAPCSRSVWGPSELKGMPEPEDLQKDRQEAPGGIGTKEQERRVSLTLTLAVAAS